MAQRLRSQVHYRLRLRRSPRTGRWPFSPTCRARRSGSAGSRTARTSGRPGSRSPSPSRISSAPKTGCPPRTGGWPRTRVRGTGC
jgi:hypothetical protein